MNRFKPGYIHPFFIFIFLSLYYGLIYLLQKVGINAGDFEDQYISELKYFIMMYIFNIIGAFIGWWIYKVVTKPKIKKIDLNNNVDSSELSEE